jgi:hypothetical protein
VVVYLFQEQTGGHWKPSGKGQDKGYIPLRCGRLLDAFFDGDIAHFYFEVTDYIKPSIRADTARQLLNRNVDFGTAKRSYARVATDLGLAAKQSADALAFQRFVTQTYQPAEWRTRSLGSSPLDVTYDIVFVRVGGIFHERSDRLVPVKPRLKALVGNPSAEYPLLRKETYHIQVATFLRANLPAELPGQGKARMNLDFDGNVVTPVGPVSFSISSHYDLHYWPFSVDGSSRYTTLTVTCHHHIVPDQENFVRKELLCPDISLPISLVVA